MPTPTALDQYRPEVLAQTADAEEFLAATKELSEEDEDEPELARLVVVVSEEEKAWEQRRFKITRPMDEAKAEVMDLFRPRADFLKKAKKAIKAKIARITDRKLAAQQAALAAAAKTGNTKAIAKAAKPPPKVAGVRKRQVKRWEVEDESKIPKQYWVRVLDKAALEMAVIDDVDVPGVRVWMETIVSAGRGL
jgi:hypothetical protein